MAGRVRDDRHRALARRAQVLVDDGVGAVTDTAANYRVRAVRTGWHRVAARLIGYRGVVLDSVFVRAGATITADFALEASAVELAPLVVTAPVDELLDPLATSQRAEDHRRGSPRSARQLARGGHRAFGRERRDRAIAAGAWARSRSSSTGSASRTSSMRRAAGLGLRICRRISWARPRSSPTASPPGMARRFRAWSTSSRAIPASPGRAGRVRDRPAVRRLARSRAGPRRRRAPAGPSPAGVGLVAALDVAGRLDDDPVNAPAPDRSARSAQSAALSPAAQQRRAVERRRQARRPGRVGRRRSGCWACTRKTSGCSSTRPTSTTPTSPRPAACAATW